MDRRPPGLTNHEQGESEMENQAPPRHSRWLIRPQDGRIEFTASFGMITTATGRARSFRGAIDYDEADPTRSSVEVAIDAASLETGEPTRDVELRSSDFFDVARFPTISFVSRRIVAHQPPHYEVRGDLTIRGITREVTLQTTFQREERDLEGKRRAGFSARTAVAPLDYGLTWNRTWALGWIPIGDRVEIAIRVDAVAADEPIGDWSPAIL